MNGPAGPQGRPDASHQAAVIMIVAGSRLTRAGIAHLLEQEPRLRDIAAVATPAELARPGRKPDLIIWDQASSPGGDPAEVVAELASYAPVLVIVGPGPASGLLALVQAGARSLLTGHASDEEFLAAARATSRGAAYLGADLTSQLNAELRQQRPSAPGLLSPREIQTLRLVADGCTHRQIARRLGLTEETINTYVKRIRVKLGAGNKAELTRKAIDLGYTTAQQPPDSRLPKLAAVQPLRPPA
jgi:DNA-binding NarL/FixJ family response regulator